MYVCMYVCMHVCTYVYLYYYTYIYIYIYIWNGASYMCVYIYIYMDCNNMLNLKIRNPSSSEPKAFSAIILEEAQDNRGPSLD